MDGTFGYFNFLDTRSFSSLWYWIVLATIWSMASYRVMGIPFDMIKSAKKYGENHLIRLETMADLQAQRHVFLSSQVSPIGVALMAAAFSGLAVLGFWFGLELAQALFLLLFPLILASLLAFRCAKQVHSKHLNAEILIKRLYFHRFQTQLLGMAAIFLTSLWGMYQNIIHGVFP